MLTFVSQAREECEVVTVTKTTTEQTHFMPDLTDSSSRTKDVAEACAFPEARTICLLVSAAQPKMMSVQPSTRIMYTSVRLKA